MVKTGRGCGMGKFVKGDVVVIPFPFSDLSASKRRPALVLAKLKSNDVILCQITSQLVSDEQAIILINSDFKEGNLQKESRIRPNKLFTADSGIILKRVGKIKKEKQNTVVNAIIHILSN